MRFAADRHRAGVHDAVPLRAARHRVPPGVPQGAAGLPGRHQRARRALRHQAHAAGRRHQRAAEPGVRRGGRLGHREVRLPRQERAAHADRPAVLGEPGDRGPDLRAGVRAAGLVRRVAARPRPEGDLRRAGHRAGHDVRDLPVHRARADPADAGARHRAGRGGARARRQRLADLPPRDAAEREVGAALRRDPVQRAGDGRVRRGERGLGPHPRAHQHDAAAHRDRLQRIPVRRRLRGGLAARRPRPRHAGGEVRGRAAGEARNGRSEAA